MELQRDSFPNGTKLHCILLFKSVNFSAILGMKPFGKQLSSETKLSHQLNMKQNERENQRI